MASTVITAIAAQKGGTGKTALTGSLGPLWAYAGARTLLIDLDQQANLTFAFAVHTPALPGTIVDVLPPRNPMNIDEVIVEGVHDVVSLDLVPCDERAEALDTQLRSETMGVYRLKDALEPLIGRYDRVFIDCPPNVGELTVSALLAANEIICPVKMGDTNALRGLSRLTQTVEKLTRRGATVGFKSLVKVECDETELDYRLNSEALETLARRLELPVAGSEIRRRAAWRKAVTQDVPLILLDERDRSSQEAQTDAWRVAHELWPEVDFPYPSEIRAERRARTAQAA